LPFPHSPQVEDTLTVEKLEAEKRKAYDLIDMITKSGFLDFTNAAIHVVTVATHVFSKNVISTVIEDNVNPVEKLERSNLVMASTIYQKEGRDLVAAEFQEAIQF
jgi:hypothetical protein